MTSRLRLYSLLLGAAASLHMLTRRTEVLNGHKGLDFRRVAEHQTYCGPVSGAVIRGVVFRLGYGEKYCTFLRC